MQTDVRDALVAFVDTDFQAAFPTIPLVHDNAPFDWNNPPASFVTFEVQFYFGAQADISANPKTRYRGFVYVTAYGRTNTGSRSLLVMLDWFSANLKYAYVAPVHLQAPEPAGSQDVKGWYTQQLKVPFYTDLS